MATAQNIAVKEDGIFQDIMHLMINGKTGQIKKQFLIKRGKTYSLKKPISPSTAQKIQHHVTNVHRLNEKQVSVANMLLKAAGAKKPQTAELVAVPHNIPDHRVDYKNKKKR